MAVRRIIPPFEKAGNFDLNFHELLEFMDYHSERVKQKINDFARDKFEFKFVVNSDKVIPIAAEALYNGDTLYQIRVAIIDKKSLKRFLFDKQNLISGLIHESTWIEINMK